MRVCLQELFCTPEVSVYNIEPVLHLFVHGSVCLQEPVLHLCISVYQSFVLHLCLFEVYKSDE
jgi:hypothetical protein